MTATRQDVATEAVAWLRTPYHHHARLKGVGVDCAQILLGIYPSLGLAPEIDPGEYAPDWHLHRGEEIYREWLVAAGAHQVSEPDVGDVALFKFGRTHSHGAIVVEAGDDPLFVHAYIGRGVIPTRLSEEPLHARPVEYWSVF